MTMATPTFRQTLQFKEQLQTLILTIGTRSYTNDYNVADNQSVTASIDVLDIALGNRLYVMNMLLVTINQLPHL